MRLAIIADTAHFVGADGQVHTLAPVLTQLNRVARLFESVVVCAPLHEGQPPESFEAYPFPIEFVPLRPGGGSTLRAKLGLVPRVVEWWLAARRVARSADALHFRCPSNVSAVALVSTWTMKRKVFAMYAGSWSGYEGEPLTYRAQRRLLKTTPFPGFVTVYGRACDDPPHVVDFFSPSFDDDEWAGEEPVAARKLGRLKTLGALDPVRVVSVGALTPNKGHDLVIRAVARLRDDGRAAHLEIVGGGPEASRLEDVARAEGVDDVVSFVGAASRARVRDAFRAADIAVLASRTEGYPKVVVEAMVDAAVPVVTRFALGEQIVGSGERGVVADRTPDAIADAIRSLASDPDRLAKMAEAGRRYTRERTLDVFEAELRGFIEEYWSRRSGLRVLQVVDVLDPGGRERLVVDLANELVSRGVESHVCETRSQGQLGAELDPRVATVCLQRCRRWDLSSTRAFATYVRRNRIDVVHAHGRAVVQFCALAKTLHRLDVPLVFHDHLPGVDAATAAPRPLRVACRVAVDGVIAVSDDLGAWAKGPLGVTPGKVWVVRNGIDTTRFSGVDPVDLRRTFDLPSAAPVVVAVANVREQKDYETLLRAVSRARSAPALVIVGSEGDPSTPYAQRCRALARDLGIESRVAFAGPRHDVPALLAGADLGALTSKHESGPIVVAEYAAAGLPFVATATGDVAVAMRGEPFCRLVAPGDVAAVAGAIDELVALPDRDALGELARRRARDFSLEEMAANVEKVYAALRKAGSW